MMNQISKVFCYICKKGFADESTLLQHIHDGHPDSYITKRIAQIFQTHSKCPVCKKEVTKPQAFFLHFSKYHPKDYEEFKTVIGFETMLADTKLTRTQKIFFFNEKQFPPINLFYFYDNFDELLKVIGNSPITIKLDLKTLLVKQPNFSGRPEIIEGYHLLFISCDKGLILVVFHDNKINEAFNKLGNNEIMVLGNYEEISYLKEKGLPYVSNAITQPFLSFDYIEFVKKYGDNAIFNNEFSFDLEWPMIPDVKMFMKDFALVHLYLLNIEYYGDNVNDPFKIRIHKCPMCSFTSQKKSDVYQHLFKVHPIASSALGQNSSFSRVPKCSLCDFQYKGYVSLIHHFRKKHLKELLEQVLLEIEKSPNEEDAQNLKEWIEDERQIYIS